MLDGECNISVMSLVDGVGGIANMKSGYYSGKKKTFCLETITGHKIYATGNHKFLEYENRWTRLDKLSSESMIAVPLGFDLSDNKEHGKDLSEARFIAMFLANGCALKSRSIQYTSNVLDEDLCDQIIKDANKITGNKLRPYKKKVFFKARESSWLNVFFPSKELPTKKREAR